MRKFRVLALAVLLMPVLALTLGAQVTSAIGEGFSDDFSGSSLYSGWTFVNPAGGGSYSLISNPGWLRITSPNNYDLGGTNDNAPRMMQQVTGDFIAFTKVSGTFTASSVHAGLIVYKDNTHFMRVEIRDSNVVQIGGKNGGSFVYSQYSLGGAVTPIYLKLEKTGTTVKGSWSSDGVTWNQFGTQSLTGSDPVTVGLFVINQYATPPTFSVDFDYFTINPQLFVVPEYPIGTIAIPIAMAVAFITYRHKPWTKKAKSALT